MFEIDIVKMERAFASVRIWKVETVTVEFNRVESGFVVSNTADVAQTGYDGVNLIIGQLSVGIAKPDESPQIVFDKGFIHPAVLNLFAVGVLPALGLEQFYYRPFIFTFVIFPVSWYRLWMYDVLHQGRTYGFKLLCRFLGYLLGSFGAMVNIYNSLLDFNRGLRDFHCYKLFPCKHLSRRSPWTETSLSIPFRPTKP